MKLRWTTGLLFVMASILALTALGKLSSAAAPVSGRFDSGDGVFPFLTVRQVLMWTAVAECMAVVVLWLHQSQTLKVLTVTFFASGFIAYRSVLLAGDIKQSCGCSGEVWKAFGLSDAQIESLNLLAFLVFVAAWLLYVWAWLSNRPSRRLNPPDVSIRSRETPRVPTADAALCR